ncbi:MAG: hypothetical protein M1372_02975, partial [Patescibacteria group bacterium]|nr:hypothetical protein [Patescibacteria group bacterium]
GALEAGISSAAIAAEATTAAAGTAAATAAEGAAVGVSQAGAVVSEGAAQAVGAVTTEAAAGATPAAAEVAPGAVVDAGIEEAGREELAAGVERTLEASGSDAALDSLAGTSAGSDTIVSSAPTPGAPLAEGGIPSLGADQATEPLTGNVSADSGIPEEVRNDPRFQEMLDRERSAAQERGEPIDEQKLSQDALTKYNQDKQGEQQQLTPEQQRIQQLEEEINRLTTETAELRANMAQINESLGQMRDVLANLTQAMAEKEQDPKKKENLLMLLAKIAGIVVASSVIQAGQEVSPLQKH